VTETLDSALKARVRAVLDGRQATEAELRKLTEQGTAVALILDARRVRSERRLTELSADPESSLAEIAAAVRTLNDLRPELAELRMLLAALDALARECRASWLAVR
jgi:hypothetical protein